MIEPYTTELTTFVAERIGEDERFAQEAGHRSRTWTVAGTWHLEGVEHAVIGDEEAFCYPHNRHHIARHDPTRALTAATAMRAILEAHPLTDRIVGYGTGTETFGCMVCHDWDGVTDGHGYCDTLRALAAVWHGHADFRPEWSLPPHEEAQA